jgi:hypothetical protein
MTPRPTALNLAIEMAQFPRVDSGLSVTGSRMVDSPAKTGKSPRVERAAKTWQIRLEVHHQKDGETEASEGQKIEGASTCP